MAIISVTTSDTISETVQHSIAPGAYQASTFIPRGVATHNGTFPIPTLAGGNQTQFLLTLTFPTNYTYLLKQMSVHYRADTIEATTFGDVGMAAYVPGQGTNLNVNFELLSNGNVGTTVTLRSGKVWQPFGKFPRQFLDGSAGDSCVVHLEDLDAAADGQVAGDMRWNFEWYFFDQEQMRNYPVHTAAPVLSY